MDINAIVLELFSRVKALEERVAALEAAADTANRFADRPSFPEDKVSKKYLPLARRLYEDWGASITLGYSEIEGLLGFPLPPTAHDFPKSYWANTLTHTYASAWMRLGYKARVDYEAKRVTFFRQ